ncbi:hypothetical protein [Actinoplanes derwentensis]|uniref:hypothetical protein n=2 Tax=Actinoplanes derwentensis TaxID=113562 RepID=UPI0012FE6B9F|nr:hypothetical protein [Actinoplanes derwentensis]
MTRCSALMNAAVDPAGRRSPGVWSVAAATITLATSAGVVAAAYTDTRPSPAPDPALQT